MKYQDFMKTVGDCLSESNEQPKQKRSINESRKKLLQKKQRKLNESSVNVYELEDYLNSIGKEFGIDNVATILEFSDDAFLDKKHHEGAYVIKFKYLRDSFERNDLEAFKNALMEQIAGWCDNNGYTYRQPAFPMSMGTIIEPKQAKEEKKIEEAGDKGGKLIFDYTVSHEARKKCEGNEFLSRNLIWREDGKDQEAKFECEKSKIIEELKKIGYAEENRDFFISESINEASDQFSGLREVLANVEKQFGIVLDTEVNDCGKGEFSFDTNYNRNTFETETEATEFENKYQEEFQKWCNSNGYECNRSEDEDAPLMFWIREKSVDEDREEAPNFEKTCNLLKDKGFSVHYNPNTKNSIEFSGIATDDKGETCDSTGHIDFFDDGTITYVVTFSVVNDNEDTIVLDDVQGSFDEVEKIVDAVSNTKFDIEETEL